jgi:hypothetical protein
MRRDGDLPRQPTVSYGDHSVGKGDRQQRVLDR